MNGLDSQIINPKDALKAMGLKYALTMICKNDIFRNRLSTIAKNTTSTEEVISRAHPAPITPIEGIKKKQEMANTIALMVE